MITDTVQNEAPTDWEIAEENRKREIDDMFSIEEARGICENFASNYGLSFTDDCQVGFGRPAVAFCDADDKYIHYDPIDLNDDNYRTIVESGDVHAPDGVEEYHKDSLLVVLKKNCDTNLVKFLTGMIGAVIGNEGAVEKSNEMDDVEVPQASTDRAIKQMALWVRTLEERGTVSIVKFNTGATGIQALIDGGTTAHAIVITKE